MTILGNQAIRQAIEAGHIHCDPAPAAINDAHIDVRIGEWYWHARRRGWRARLREWLQGGARLIWLCGEHPRDWYELHTCGMAVVIAPRSHVLAHTIEYIGTTVPTLVPNLDTRSTLARWGLSVHMSAGHGDPGFAGRWTLEMFNPWPWSVAIPVGARVGSITFSRVEGHAGTYTARYDTGAAWKPEDMLPRRGNW